MRRPLTSPRSRLGTVLTALLLAAVSVAWTPAAPLAAAEPSHHDGPTAARIVQPMMADSSAVPCASGTKSLGVLAGYYHGEKTMLHLCELTNLPSGSSAEENDPASRYYVPGSDRHAVVNARISATAYDMVQAARGDGVDLIATSSFRRDAQQRDLYQCYLDHKPGCMEAEQPGWSIHQMGLAFDFAMPDSVDTCTGGAAQNSPAWKWLHQHADQYGFHQLRTENWHWDTSTAGDPMCE